MPAAVQAPWWRGTCNFHSAISHIPLPHLSSPRSGGVWFAKTFSLFYISIYPRFDCSPVLFLPRPIVTSPIKHLLCCYCFLFPFVYRTRWKVEHVFLAKVGPRVHILALSLSLVAFSVVKLVENRKWKAKNH